MGAHPWGRRKPPGSWAQRRRILTRDPVCRCAGCPRCTPSGCTQPSTDDDHIVPIHLGGSQDTADDSNHQGLCRPCHDHKSRLEAQAARAAAPRVTTRRPPEAHPGLL
jgi:5-methylcytosine-specific restriction enzyme A